MMNRPFYKKPIPQIVAAAAFTAVLAWPGMAQEWGSFEDETEAQSAPDSAVSDTLASSDSSGLYGEYSLERKIEISSELLASSAFLWTQKDARGYVLPGNGIVDEPEGRAAFQLHEKVTVKPVGEVDYKLGDTVDVLRPIKLISFKGKTANLVKRTGMAVVEGHSEKKLVVSLVQMWDVIRGGERIAPTVSHNPISLDSLEAPDKNIQASVLMRVEKTVAPYLHQSFIIDKGAKDGVRLGDHFTVYEEKKGDSMSEELLVGLVTHVTPSASTLVILKLYSSQLNEGDQAFLTRRVHQE
ncbi:MAG: hypothetical protein ACLFQB_10690 [Chitinispirillaceae bacterium]